MTVLRSFAPPAILLAVVVLFLLASFGYPADSRAMPVLVGAVMVVLLGLDLLSRAGNPAGRAVLRWLNPVVAVPPGSEGRSLLPVLSIVLFGLGLGLLGTVVAVPAFVLGAMRLHGRHSLAASAGTALVVLLFVVVLFSVLLKLPLYPGLLFGGDF